MIFVISIDIIKTSSPSLTEDQMFHKTKKFLFMYKYPLLKDDPNHKLNIFTYKNVLLSEDQMVFFESTNEGDPVKIFFKNV